MPRVKMSEVLAMAEALTEAEAIIGNLDGVMPSFCVTATGNQLTASRPTYYHRDHADAIRLARTIALKAKHRRTVKELMERAGVADSQANEFDCQYTDHLA